MADEKDRLGDKLHQAGRAREDQWARQLDAEIIERLRRKICEADSLSAVRQESRR